MVKTKPTKNEVPEMDERTKQKFEDLKRKYFWQQKRKEIGFAFIILGLCLLFVFIVMPLIGLVIASVNHGMIKWMEGFSWLGLGVLLSSLAFVLLTLYMRNTRYPK